jgi:hypothetical protein
MLTIIVSSHTRAARYSLIVVDEVGYIPFEPEAANRLKDRDLGRVPTANTEEPWPTRGSTFKCRVVVSFGLPLTSHPSSGHPLQTANDCLAANSPRGTMRRLASRREG